MKSILAFLFVSFLAFPNSSKAQNVTITEHGRVGEMMSIYTNNNKQESHIQAWRIQIITTDDRRRMETARAKFAQLYPEIQTSWKHVSPWYHLKAGAYKTKLELQGFLLQVKENFPGAIPILDRVKKEELLSP